MNTSYDLIARYPTLTHWLEGAPEDHPWMVLITDPDPFVAAMARPMESILAELERVRPERLAGKRTVFRQDVLGALNLRAELNVGWMLAQSQCVFAFGREGEPDYKCSLESGTAWVEVTTKSRDDLSQLHSDLTSALQGHSVMVELSVPRLLVIPEPERQAACSLVLRAVEAMTESHVSVRATRAWR